VDEIWQDDLLGRRKDAAAIQTFLVNRSTALAAAGRSSSFTLAIDGEYGVGKSFLLKRLYTQVGASHPAAFIDAWADDTIDAPWAALLVALEQALKPYEAKIDHQTRARLKRKGIQLIAALAKGAAKKGASYVIGEEGWDDAVDSLFEKEGESRIAEYQERKRSIKELRDELNSVLKSVRANGVVPPLFVFVDELDRCRPTYAIQFLEQIKHIFDIPQIVFVMAMHVGQLSKAVKALYGSDFDGEEYLRRFIDKNYVLSDPGMSDLVQYHCHAVGLGLTTMRGPPTEAHGVLSFIAKSCEYWMVRPRDALRVIDALATAQALWVYKVPLQLELLLPLIIASVKGKTRAQLLEGVRSGYVPIWEYQGQYQREKMNPAELFNQFWSHRHCEFNVLRQSRNEYGIEGAIRNVLRSEFELRKPISLDERTLMARYPELVQSLAHFAESSDQSGA